MTNFPIAGGNALLGAAKKARKDEFYTQLTDIEKARRAAARSPTG